MSGVHEVSGAIHGKGYVLVRPLTDGASSLFEARHDRLPGRYVVRLFPSDIRSRSEVALRFQSGARMSSLIRHPGIVQVFDFNLSGEDPAFVVMEYVEGRSLEQFLAKDGMLPLPLVVDIMEQLADALAAAHSLGVVHGDLHPGSILLTGDAGSRVAAKVLGFGWAKELRVARKRPGLSSYIAPELLAAGPQKVDERADQFSLAAIVYEMLAGCSHLTEESTDLADPDARRYRQPPSVAELVLGLPGALDDILRRALSYEPAERFPRLQDFVSGLKRVAEARPSASTAAAMTPSWHTIPSLDMEGTPTPPPMAAREASPVFARNARGDVAGAAGKATNGIEPLSATGASMASVDENVGATVSEGSEGESVASEGEGADEAASQITPPPIERSPALVGSSAVAEGAWEGEGIFASKLNGSETTPAFAEAAALAALEAAEATPPPAPQAVSEPALAAATGDIAAGGAGAPGVFGGNPTPPLAALVSSASASTDVVSESLPRPSDAGADGEGFGASPPLAEAVAALLSGGLKTPVPALASSSEAAAASAQGERTPNPSSLGLGSGGEAAMEMNLSIDESTPPLVAAAAMVAARTGHRATDLLGSDPLPEFSDPSPESAESALAGPALLAARPITKPRLPIRTRVLFLTATLAIVVAAVSVMSGSWRKPAPEGASANAANPANAPAAAAAAAPNANKPASAPGTGIATAAGEAAAKAGAGPTPTMNATASAEPRPAVAAPHAPAVLPGSTPSAARSATEVRADRPKASRARSRRGASHGAGAHRERRVR